MAQYHVSSDGAARPCKAQVGRCPLTEDDGSSIPHGDFADNAQAQQFAEEVNAQRFGGSFGGPAVQKASKPDFSQARAIEDSYHNPFEDAQALFHERSLYSNDGMDDTRRKEWEAEAEALGINPSEQSEYNTEREFNFMNALAQGKVKGRDGIPFTMGDLKYAQSLYSNDGMDGEERAMWQFDAAALGLEPGETKSGAAVDFTKTAPDWEIIGQRKRR